MTRYSHMLLTTVTISAVLCGRAAAAAPPATPTPVAFAASPSLFAPLLASERLEALRGIVSPSIAGNSTSYYRRTLCSSLEVTSPSDDPILRVALAKTESAIAADIRFERTLTQGKDTEAPEFSLFVEFKGDSVLLRSSLPRYPSDQNGVLVPYPTDRIRPLFLEGADGTSVVAYVPPIDSCAVEGVLLCPRSRASTGELLPTKYAPTGWVISSFAKADGLFGPPKESVGRIQAALLGTEGVVIPDPFFESRIGSAALAVKRKTPSKDKEGDRIKPKRVPIQQLPATAAVEARLELGTATEVQRTIFSRSSISISELPFTQPSRATIGAASYLIETGPCYLVAGWTEIHK